MIVVIRYYDSNKVLSKTLSILYRIVIIRFNLKFLPLFVLSYFTTYFIRTLLTILLCTLILHS